MKSLILTITIICFCSIILFSKDTVMIKNYKWEKEEFYNNVICSFEIQNKTDTFIKKIRLTFLFYNINDSLVYTKKEKLKINLLPNKNKTIREYNLGFIPNSAKRSELIQSK